MLKYRDRSIPRSLIKKLREEFPQKFIEDDVKKEWNSYLICYRHEAQNKMLSRSSEAGIDEMFN